MAVIWGSSQTDPNYANFKGSQTYAPRTVPQTSSYNLPTFSQPVSTPAPAPVLSNNNSGLDPHINPASGAWDDNYFAQNQPKDPNAEARRIAEEQAAAALNAALTQFDQYAENAVIQKTELENQQSSILSGLETQRGKASNQATTSTTQAQQATKTAKNKALSTAQDIEKKNRNTLRALGILSSSAGGEMMNAPYNELGKVNADLQQGLVNRVGEIDQWLRDRNTEIDQATNDVKNQFATLVQRINSDMRFNDRQRIDAVQQANAALSATLQEIQTRKEANDLAARQFTSQMLGQIAQIQLYQNPQADVSGILSQSIAAVNPTYNSQNTQIYDPRKRLSSPA
jgi:hypothetical protein